ncbi:preprotein translocase subunit SecA [bacterium]|nr:preprotein translocase subunit SecA [bacterium]
MLGLLKRLFDANDKEVKKVMKTVEKINKLEPTVAPLEDADLRAKTAHFRDRLAKGETLDDILPEAYAVAREASKRVRNERHYDVQLVGAIVLHQGRIAEMKTGEGKTLVAVAALYLNALGGNGAHLVTANDYLAKRDGMLMAHIYDFLGLTTGVINHDSAYLFDASAQAGPNKDPLRPCSRQEAYRADITYGTNNEYGFDYLRDNMVWQLEDKVQRGHHFAIVDEVDSILIDEARTPLIISGRGQGTNANYEKFAQMVRQLKKDEHYTVDEKSKNSPLNEDGVARVEELLGIRNLYDMENVESAHLVSNALRAKECYRNDVEYVIRDDEIVIVDEFTGRLMFGRRYSDGLHQAIEAKEGVKIRQEDQTLASITFQNYFKMYKKLAGMTGTAATEEREFREIYGVDVIVIPTHRPISRKDQADIVYKDERLKFLAVCEEIAALHEAGRPVLVGSRSIDKSEALSRILKEKGVPHNVLNAKYHEQEASIIAQAGRLGGVTIATNMAGRGVDIILGGNPPDAEAAKKVRELGGLHILGTERHESRRIDNQLRGRSGRQGDPGSSRFFVSLDDELMRLFGSDRIKNVMEWLKVDDEPIESGMVSKGIENAQQKVESYHFDIRKSVLRYDDTMNNQRKVIYEERDRILRGEDLRPHVLHFVKTLALDWVNTYCSEEIHPDEWETDLLWEQVRDVLDLPEDHTLEQLLAMPRAEMVDQLVKWSETYYEIKESLMGHETMRSFEKWVLLQTLDGKWIDHLQSIDMLREGIGLRGYGQKDPQIEFIKEAFEMFEGLKHRIQEDTVRLLFKLEVRQGEDIPEDSVIEEAHEVGVPVAEEPPAARGRVRSKMSRNDPCWCGSGTKWKKCHYPDEG